MSDQLSAISFQPAGSLVAGFQFPVAGCFQLAIDNRQSAMAGRRPAFTLIELMVVVGIIVILLAVAVPAIGPMLSSNEAAQAMNTMGGLVTTAQTLAESLATPVGLRIEQAFTPKTIQNKSYYNNVPYPAMRDVTNLNDKVDYLPYQQVRLVKYSDKPEPDPSLASFQPAFEPVGDTRVTALPKTAWVAPMECLDLDSKGSPIWKLDANLSYTPAVCSTLKTGYSPPGLQQPVPFNRLDTFYIVFDRFGGVRRFPDKPIVPTDPSTHYWYRDRMQLYPDPVNSDPAADPIFPLVDHPDYSARGMLIYNREQFQELPNVDADRRAFLSKAKPVYVSRSLGELVEGRQ